MADSKDFYTGKDLAELYRTARAKLPEEFLKKILAFLSEKHDLAECVAVDIGCGSGQSTIPLAKHLKHVTGVDVSEDQISEGNRTNRQPNVTYKCGTAEKLPIPDSSVHLVLTSNAFHWFDRLAFFKEVDRVLIPNGVLAISSGTLKWSYKDGKDDDKLPQMTDLADDINDSYWSVTTQGIPMYDKLELPYGSAASKEFVMIPEEITMASLMDRMKSIAGVSQFMKAKSNEAQERLQDFQDRFMKFLGSNAAPEETTFILNWLYIICLTRKPNL